MAAIMPDADRVAKYARRQTPKSAYDANISTTFLVHHAQNAFLAAKCARLRLTAKFVHSGAISQVASAKAVWATVWPATLPI